MASSPVPDGISVIPYAGDGEDWDAFVRGANSVVAPTHCHLYGWRGVMEGALGHDAPYLAAIDGASRAMVGVLPLVRVRSMLFGHFLVSVPFVNYGGPLGSAAAIRALLTYARTMSVADGASLLELRSRYELGAVPDYSVSHRKITVLMDVAGGSDAMWKRIPSKVRSQIRRPQKDGVTVRIGLDQARAFYIVFARHMRDLGTPVMPWKFFELVIEQFADSATFAVAYHDSEPIACGAGFMWGGPGAREFEITWASALRKYNRMSPNMLVYWELMKHVSDAGARVFNFGRCTPGGSTHRFKSQWGSRDESLSWYDYSPRGGGPMREDSPVARVATRIWKHMPLPLANRLGPRLVRLIPL